MADNSTLTLDEIIKKKKIRPFKKQNVKAVKTTKGKKAAVKRLGTKGPLKKTVPQKNIVKDARNKIIQKKKQKMGDARERLGELARQGDARQRLNSIRKTGVKETRIGPQGAKSRLGPAGAKKAALIKKQLAVQTGNNFKKNVTGQGKNLTRTVAGVAGKAARNQAGGLKTAKNIKPAANRPVAKAKPQGQKQKMVVVKNQQRRAPVQVAQSFVQRAPFQQRYQGMRSDMIWETNPYPPQRIYQQPRPVVVEQIRPYRETIYVDQYGNEVDGPFRPRPVYVEAAPPPRSRLSRPAPGPVRVRKQQPMSASMAGRLEAKQPKAKPQQQGHKVLVTNLHPCVSGEDMEELFSTIGTIVAAKMLREGVAEAVFSKEEDALRSVEVFHNRQLDGLPMNVTIVSKKSKGGQPKSVLKAARGRTGYY